MYKFNNGVVVFTEEDKENFLKAGYTLVEEKDEKKDSNVPITEEYKSDKKVNSRFRKKL